MFKICLYLLCFFTFKCLMPLKLSFASEIKSGLHVIEISKNKLSFLKKGWDEKLKNIHKRLKLDSSKVSFEDFNYRSFFEFLDKKKNVIISINPNGYLFYYNITEKKNYEIKSNLYSILNKFRLSEKTPFLMEEQNITKIDWLAGTGARDIEFIDTNKKKYMFVLISIQTDKYCMKDVVLKSKINFVELGKNLHKSQTDSLIFTKIFEEDDCAFRDPNQSSSRIEKYDVDSILITQGLGQIRDTSDKTKIFSSIPVKEWPVGKTLKVNIHDGSYEIFSRGHRNPQGLHVSKDGHILATEHGQRGGDEINILQKNNYYGWPEVSYGIGYGEEVENWQKNHGKFSEPLYYFLPSIGISEIILYNHHEFSRWNKNILVGSLKRKSLFKLDINWDEKKVKSVEEIDIGCSIRDMEVNNIGKIYILCDNLDLIEISKSKNDYK